MEYWIVKNGTNTNQNHQQKQKEQIFYRTLLSNPIEK